MTSHHDVTTTSPDPATDIKTSKHLTSKHKTSPPWNSRKLVHSKGMVWAWRWSVALRTFYRQILSLLYVFFFLLKLPPPARPGTTCILYYTTMIQIDNRCCPSLTGSNRSYFTLSPNLGSSATWQQRRRWWQWKPTVHVFTLFPYVPSLFHVKIWKPTLYATKIVSTCRVVAYF